jgi:hypothetical protein
MDAEGDVCVEVGALLPDTGDAVLTAPGDERVRELFLDESDWHSTTWISREGTAFQRHYNPWSATWSFVPKLPGVGPDGELLLTTGSGAGARRMRLVRALALAWVEPPHTAWGSASPGPGPADPPADARKVQDAALVAVHLVPDEPPRADTVGWVRRGLAPRLRGAPRTLHVSDARPLGPQEWQRVALLRDWGGGTRGEEFDLGDAWLSAAGWLALPDGSLSRGVRSYNGRLRFCTGAGSVWCAELVAAVFLGGAPDPRRARATVDDGDEANCTAANVCYREPPVAPRACPPAADAARALLAAGGSFDHLCADGGVARLCGPPRASNVRRSTAWRWVHDATADLCALPLARRNVFWDGALWCIKLRRAVDELIALGHPSLGGSLGELRQAVEARCDLELNEGDLYGMLRVARQYALVHCPRWTSSV